MKAQRLSKMVTELRSQKEQIERDVCHDEQKIIEAGKSFPQTILDKVQFTTFSY